MKPFNTLWWLMTVVLVSVGEPISAGTVEYQSATWQARTDRAAVLRVPEGTRRVRVQSRQSSSGAWELVGITHLPGASGTLKLRLPDGVALENILIETSTTDPFPYSYYQGSSSFAAPAHGGALGGPGRADLFANASAGDETESVTAAQTVEESDIWKWRDHTLYYFNSLRGLQVFDLSDATAPKRLASLRLPAVGEDMYLLGTEHAALLSTRYEHYTGAESSEVRVLRHQDSTLEEVARVPVDGRFIESRLVGTLLCVVTQRTEAKPNAVDGTIHYQAVTRVVAVDLANPAAPRLRGSLELPNPEGIWTWRTVIHATTEFLFVSTDAWSNGLGYRSLIHVIDLRSPDQPLTVAAAIPVGGHLQSKFHLAYDSTRGILTTVTQADGANVETWDIPLAIMSAQPGLPRPLDSMVVGRGERLFGTRFDGDRVHVVTFRQIDPLFCIDLSDARKLRLLGELEVPGFSTYLEAFADGDRLLSLGVEDFRVAVSLFDVGDPSQPVLRSRVRFGDQNHGSWSEGNYDDKAIGFFRGAGLMAFPLSSWSASQGYRQGMQLVDVSDSDLRARGFIPHRFNARRARLLGNSLVSISGTELIIVDVSDRDEPRQLSALTIAWPVDGLEPLDETLIQVENGDEWQWGDTAAARHAHLRLTPKSDADLVLAEIDLGSPGAVSGLARRGSTVAVLLQSTEQRAVSGEDDDVVHSPSEWIRSFTVIILDISNPRSPQITGRTTDSKSEPGWGWGTTTMRAQWLPDGRLLWHPNEVSSGGWLRCFNCLLGGPAPGALIDVAMPFWGGSSATDFLVVDLADVAAPRILVREAVVPGLPQAWQSGGGRTFMETPDRLLISWTSWEMKTDRWVEESWVQAIHFNGSGSPSRSPKASIPGSLQGFYRNEAGGLVLFTTRPETSQDATGFVNWTGHAIVEALAYDGTQAFLLGSLRVDHSAGASAVVVGRHVLVAKPRVDWSPGSPPGSALHVIAWDEATGKLASLDPLPVAASYPSLQAEGGFVFLSEGRMLEVLAAHQLPQKPERSIFDLNAHYWWANSVALDASAREAWWKAGLYGVERLDLSSLPFPSNGPRIAHREVSLPEWVVMTWNPLDVVSARVTTFPGPLHDSAKAVFIPDTAAETYEAWSLRWFGREVWPTSDDDGDGFDAYSEWAFGSSPMDPLSAPTIEHEIMSESGQPPRIALIARYNPLAVLGPCGLCSALELIPERSVDLRQWSPVVDEEREVVDTPGRRIIIISPRDSTAREFFARLRVFFQVEG